jgi:hypothetical protein
VVAVLLSPDGRVIAQRRTTAIKQSDSTAANPLQTAIAAGVSWNGQNPGIPAPVKLNAGGPLMSDGILRAGSHCTGIAVCRIPWPATTT